MFYKIEVRLNICVIKPPQRDILGKNRKGHSLGNESNCVCKMRLT